MGKMKIALMAAAIFLAGCDDYKEQASVNGGSIKIVTLENGLVCAVYDGFKAGGLSCDWEKHNAP